jgi:hypothetical protein
LDSLAAVVLENRRGLDLITAQKGICVFLGEKCCFCANQSGIMTENTCQLVKKIKTRKKKKTRKHFKIQDERAEPHG